jgi:hypothetical protein
VLYDIRNKVGLELIKIHIEGSIEAERCRDRGYDLRDKPVQVREARRSYCKAFLANVIDSLVIDLEADKSAYTSTKKLEENKP